MLVRSRAALAPLALLFILALPASAVAAPVIVNSTGDEKTPSPAASAKPPAANAPCGQQSK